MVDFQPDMNHRVTLVEERLNGGAEAFAELRKENRELRRQVLDMREILIEVAGRDGKGGTIAILGKRLDGHDEQATRVSSKVDDLRQVYWRLFAIAAVGGGVAGTLVSLAKYLL